MDPSEIHAVKVEEAQRLCQSLHEAIAAIEAMRDHAAEAYRVENGKLGAPIKGATLIGDGPTVLTRVTGIGNDLALDEGVGVCGKGGQSVPAGVGQPTLLVEGLTVGGTG